MVTKLNKLYYISILGRQSILSMRLINIKGLRQLITYRIETWEISANFFFDKNPILRFHFPLASQSS